MSAGFLPLRSSSGAFARAPALRGTAGLLCSGADARFFRHLRRLRLPRRQSLRESTRKRESREREREQRERERAERKREREEGQGIERGVRSSTRLRRTRHPSRHAPRVADECDPARRHGLSARRNSTATQQQQVRPQTASETRALRMVRGSARAWRDGAQRGRARAHRRAQQPRRRLRARPRRARRARARTLVSRWRAARATSRGGTLVALLCARPTLRAVPGHLVWAALLSPLAEDALASCVARLRARAGGAAEAEIARLTRLTQEADCALDALVARLGAWQRWAAAQHAAAPPRGDKGTRTAAGRARVVGGGRVLAFYARVRPVRTV